jgi:hypothetical protein
MQLSWLKQYRTGSVVMADLCAMPYDLPQRVYASLSGAAVFAVVLFICRCGTGSLTGCVSLSAFWAFICVRSGLNRKQQVYLDPRTLRASFAVFSITCNILVFSIYYYRRDGSG